MLQRLARACVWLLAGSAALVFLYLGVVRVFYPLELDYIEGVMMDHVVRLSTSRPIYVAPTLEFIPLAYMPVFATTASLLARIFGPHFWEIRIISFVSMILLAVLVFRIVWVETRNSTMAAAGAGILLMAFGVTGGHYDVGRPDSLMLLLVFSGLALLRFAGFWGTLGAAGVMTLAFFTKQHAVWFVIAALVHLAINDRRRLVVFAPAVLAGCAGGYALLAIWLGPWFNFFTWEVPTHWSEISKVRILGYVGGGLMGKLGGITIPALLAFALPQRPWRGPAGIWTWAALGAIATGMMATLDPDAFRHVLNPTVVAFSVLGPIALHGVIHHIGAWPGSERAGRSSIVYLLLSLQFLPLAYTVRGQLPRPRPDEARAELLERLRSYPGPVLMLYHGFYGWSAGKGSSLHQITLDDIVRARGNRLLAQDPTFFDRMFEPLRSGPNRPMIVTDTDLHLSGSESRALWASIAPGYRLAGELGWISESLNPVNGNHWTPRLVYVPADEPGVDLAPTLAPPDSGGGAPDDSLRSAELPPGAELPAGAGFALR